jgi:hexosaminidase
LAGALLSLLSAIGGCSMHADQVDTARATDAADASTTTASIDSLSLIPAPASIRMGNGSFALDANTPLRARTPEATRVATQFAGLMAHTRNLSFGAVDAAAGPDDAGIVFRIDTARSGSSPEAYSLDVSPRRILVSAGDERGLFYGAVTLWQLATRNDAANVTVPALHVDDAPRFGWRGLMLDSARHFQSVAEIKQLLDAMALHKLNSFHWHLTDDQGWRIQIRKYPKLTEVGGCRIPAGDGGVDPQTGKPVPYCGYYTQAQIRDVVRYAAERHITIVPEIDVPGHAQAAIAAYPELGVLGDTPRVGNEWGVNTYLFNNEESTFAFLENVLAEVVELFPGTYVHIGGDEAVKDQWIASPRVQARMKALGASDEMAMQNLLVKRLQKFLAAHGKRLIGWDEILEGDLPAQATVMSWRGVEGGIDAANRGHDVVMSPSSELYLDYLQTDSPNEPPGRPATITLKQVYAYEPVPATLAADRQAHILGLQANAWTEHMRSFARVQHAMFPRVAAVAETAWSPKNAKDWNSFLARLPAQLQRYRDLGIDYAQTPFEVRGTLAPAADGSGYKVALADQLGYPDIRYTTDGTAPTPASTAYSAPFAITMPTEIRAAAFVDGKPLATPSMRRFDAASLLHRDNAELAMCTGQLMLRLEDDGPLKGRRAIFNVDIFNPCWEWKAAPMQGIASLHVRAGNLPYYFQLAHDESHRGFKPAKTAHGEFEVRAGCDGELLASKPMPVAPGKDGFLEFDVAVHASETRQDLCMLFTGDTRPTMWVLDAVALQPAAS